MSKYIFITGGVVSGLGKGITAASLGKLMKARGFTVEVVKFNPYFNVDSSNLCPEQYGETYITEDGRCCDLVIGHYERLLDESIFAKSDITSGEIYRLIIDKERENFYDGTTVQVVPHITDEIKHCVLRVGENKDFVIVEVGGTVGDIEAQPYLEAIRQLKANLGKSNVAYVHVSLVPYIGVSGEQKTKPTQHSVRELQNLGIQPDVIVCRSDYPLGADSRSKLSLFCNVEKDCVIESLVTPGIYEIPLMLEKEGFCSVVLKKLKLEDRPCDLSGLNDFCNNLKRLESEKNSIKIGIIGKNADRMDVNMSLRHSLLISSVALNKRVDVACINTDEFNESLLENLDGIIITCDTHERSIEGKNKAISYAREKNLPVLILGDAAYLGISDKFPMNKNAKTANKNSLAAAVKQFKNGNLSVKFKENSLFYKAFGAQADLRFKSRIKVSEESFDGLDLTVSGVSEDGSVAAYELKGHRFFCGAFFRPEFTARPAKPSPIISAFLTAAKK